VIDESLMGAYCGSDSSYVCESNAHASGGYGQSEAYICSTKGIRKERTLRLRYWKSKVFWKAKPLG